MLNYPHMKRIVSILSMLGFLSFPLLSFAATTPAPNTLIKGSGPAVYYLAVDGKRYVFPTEQTYFTWYDNFDSVVTVSDTELAALPLGANVTYRPGTRMMKIESDPKVYTVAQNGSLRWVETEALAESLYGPNWATYIDDIPVGFFTSYTLGASITSAQEYQPTEVKNAALTIQDDLGITPPEPVPSVPAPEPPTSTVMGTLTASKDTGDIGEMIDVMATATPSASIETVYIYLDDLEIGYCTYSPCGTSFQTPPTKPEFSIRAEFKWITGETLTKTIPFYVNASSGQGIALSVTNPEIKPGGTLEAIASVKSGLLYSAGIGIYVNGNLKKICTATQECRYFMSVSQTVGDTYSVFAQAMNLGATIISSNILSAVVVSNDHPQITLQLGKEYIFAGETIDATIQASDTDGIASTELWVGDALVKHCDISICTAVLGPFSTTGTQAITAKATDTQGLEQTSTANFDVR